MFFKVGLIPVLLTTVVILFNHNLIFVGFSRHESEGFFFIIQKVCNTGTTIPLLPPPGEHVSTTNYVNVSCQWLPHRKHVSSIKITISTLE